jgi:hypothetical protein
MSWEEPFQMDRIRDLFRPHGHGVTAEETDRKRSKRLRYFLTVWGAMHWAERVEWRRRLGLPRRGNIAL